MSFGAAKHLPWQFDFKWLIGGGTNFNLQYFRVDSEQAQSEFSQYAR